MDCISGLPDELICHILSFLTTKEAALTSILSSRWRDLLAFVPYLYIDGSVFLHPEEGKLDREDIIQSFANFVDRVFALQGDSPIKKLPLKCLIKVGSVRVDGWISNVLTRGVSELDLAISLNSDYNDDDNDDDTYRLSPECFECSTLVKLKIECVIDIGWVPGRIFLPMLKSLHLDVVQICSNEFKVLLDSLPVLEDLVLDDVLWQDEDVIVSSASLKTLKIKLYDSLSSLSFDTPSVVYFWYSGYIASDYPLINMKNLVDAQFYFAIIDRALELARGPVNVWLEIVDEDEVALGFSNVWKLFHGVKNVPYLDLSANTLEVLSLCCESMPVFKNLKSLAIMSRKDRGWQAMPVLLRNCPNLETLVIEGLVHHVTEKCGDACECISKEDKGSSLKLCPVKVLEIQGFRGTMKEMSMIKHFLDHFPCLKEMEIYVAEDGPTLLGNREVSKHITELFKLYNQLSSCNVQLLVSDALSKKWRKNKTIS